MMPVLEARPLFQQQSRNIGVGAPVIVARLVDVSLAVVSLVAAGRWQWWVEAGHSSGTQAQPSYVILGHL